ncbi:hypothetical protein H2199_003960 [Coniosporium tulheliwenetii]|uniref:Uncharacterized protein n=1 Tax=Coniosporium tulheliwenetii TaxID=3383036 RepID=A0ACC2Z8N3_9PEZI|nr:hypothetical protein H2199_003960 [Cladosporium sp. JES 115]
MADVQAQTFPPSNHAIANPASQATQPSVNGGPTGQQDSATAAITATTQQTAAATGSQATAQAVPRTQGILYSTPAVNAEIQPTEEEGDMAPESMDIDGAGSELEDDEEEVRRRAELLEAGARNLGESLASSTSTVPKPITKIYRGAYSIVRSWFVTGLNQQQKSRLAMINRKIRQWNSENLTYNGTERQPETDYFPVNELYPQVRLLKEAVEKIDALPAGSPEREAAVSRVTSASFGFLQLLQAKGLPWQQVIHKDYVDKFTNVLTEPAAINYQRQSGLPVLQTLLVPTIEQKEIMLKAKEPLIRVVREGLGAAEELMGLGMLNAEVQRVNQENGIPQGDHNLPAVELLRADDQAKILLLAKLQASKQLGYKSVTDAVHSTRSLPPIEDTTHETDSGEPPTEVELQRVTPSTSDLSLFVQDNDVTMVDASTTSSDSEAQSATGATASSTASSTPPTSNAQAQSVDSSGAQDTPPTSNPETQPTDELDSSVFERIRDRRELPTGNDLRTDFGKVTHTRRAGKDRYRVIVNAGTDERPFFHVLPGSEFPTDVAEEYYHATGSESDYLPRNRRKFVAKVMYIVEVFGSGNAGRKPITYYWTVFKPDPAHPEYPLRIGLQDRTLSSWLGRNKRRSGELNCRTNARKSANTTRMSNPGNCIQIRKNHLLHKI